MITPPASVPAEISKRHQSPPEGASPRITILEVWVSGTRVFGRFLYFLFFFVILMAPFNMIADYINRSDRSLFNPDGFNFPAGGLLIVFALYMPFAAHFSARWSKQLQGTKTNRNKEA